MNKYGLFEVICRSNRRDTSFNDFFILEMSAPFEISEKTKEEVTKYISNRGKVLEIRYTDTVTFGNIVNMVNNADGEYPLIVKRFLEMYFTL